MSSAILKDDVMFINSLINGTACHRRSIWGKIDGWLKQYSLPKYSVGFGLLIEKIYKIRIESNERMKAFIKVDEGKASGYMYSEAQIVKFISPMKIQLVIDYDMNSDLEFNPDMN